MPPTRIAALLLPLAVAGCTKPTSFPDPKPAGAYQADTARPADPSGPPVAPGNPIGTADRLLAAVHGGTATADMLTPEFKAVVAPAVYAEDRATGYSDAAAEAWLKQFRGRLGPADRPPAEALGPNAFAVVGPAGKEQVVIRFTADGKIDWFQATPAVTAVDFPRGQPEPGKAVAAVAFLMAVVGRDDRLAAARMTPALRERLAPPFASDQQGYNRGTLAGKLARVRGGHTGFQVTGVANDVAAVTLTADGGPTKPLGLKLATGPRPWDWLVADILTE